MLLKRKRSESELSFSSGSTFSSPTRPGSSRSFQFGQREMDETTDGLRSPGFGGGYRSPAPALLHSRTMKRLRNNRPSEEVVHQHTLDILYGAQHQIRNENEPPSQPFAIHEPIQESRPQQLAAATPAAPQPVQQKSTQRSLHSFWALPGARNSSQTMASPLSSVESLLPPSSQGNCEDCGAGLGGSSSGDDAMDLDNGDLSLEACHCVACGKAVCFSCSVGNLGDERNCLACAGRRMTGARGLWAAAGGIAC